MLSHPFRRDPRLKSHPAEHQLMPSEKFCHLCGDKLIRASGPLRLTRRRCAACRRKMGRGVLLPVLLFALALGAGFVAGRATSPRRSINFIGAPIEPLTLESLPAEPRPTDRSGPGQGARPDAPAGGSGAEEAGQTLCGAPTKKGRPCRRPVRGGGHCWQHKR